MGTPLVDDPADDRFALPDAVEMVEGLTNLVASVFGPKWQASDEEIYKIAKPGATMIGRNPKLKRVVKKVSAPGVLAGAIGAYIMARTVGHLANTTIPATTTVAHAPGAQRVAAQASPFAEPPRNVPPQPQPQAAPVYQPPAPFANAGSVEPPALTPEGADDLIHQMMNTIPR